VDGWSLRLGFQPPLVRGDYSVQIADRITGFAGSMHFVYLHVVWFAAWIALGVEAYPYGLLTMIVSLEAALAGWISHESKPGLPW
jgi:uncharacterized membrane protein